MLSLSASLMVKGSLGISSVSCVPYIFSLKYHALTQGNWFFIMQGIMMAILTVWLGKFKISYLLSMLTAVIAGYLIDFFNWMLLGFRDDLPFRIFYLLLAMTLVSIGVALAFRTNLPIMAVDLFVIELAVGKNWPLKIVKTMFDVVLVLLGIVSSLLFFGKLRGIGIGTILTAVFIGQMVGFVDKKLNKYLSR